MSIPTFGPSTIYVLLVVFFLVALFLFNAFLQHRKLMQNTRGKIISVYHQPGGGEVEELCEVHGVYVFRGQPRKGSVFQTKQDVGTAREVYILELPGADHKELKDQIEETRQRLGEAAQDAASLMNEMEHTPFGDRRKRKEIRQAADDLVSEVEQALNTKWDKIVAKSMKTRPHRLYPSIMPPNKPGLLQSQVSLPVAHFIEGYTLEIDPVSVALSKFEPDPLYNAAMVGSIVDQRLLELAAWFSSYIDKLEQQLIKMINPTILYALMGIMVILLLVNLYFSFQDHSKIAQMAKEIHEYMALLPTGE